MGKWSELKAAEKARVIQFAIRQGVSDIQTIRDTFNNIYAQGGKIHIDPSKKGTFTAAATKHGKSVQEFARQVLANKENYSPAMVKKANFARNFGGHKHDGTTPGESQYLKNVKTSTHPLIYQMLSSSRGDATIPPFILGISMLKNKLSSSPSVYTGSYYFGDTQGYGRESNLPRNRNLVKLYTNGDSTGFEPMSNAPEIVLNGDTLKYNQYKGFIVPQDTIYLRPESQATISRLSKTKQLLPINNSYPGWQGSGVNFADYPYFLDKYLGKVIDDTNNSLVSFKQNNDGSYYADIIDVWDLYGTDKYGIGKKIERTLQNDTIENNGPFVLRQNVPIVFNRDSVSDGRFLNLISFEKWQEELDKDKKSTGGPLYPFSFQKNLYLKTPVVRY